MNKLLHTSLASTNIQRAIDRKLGPIVYRNPASLRPYPGNPRRHPEQQIVKLEASIGHFGFALPVLVSEAGEIIVGHARVIAAQRLGMTEVPALVASHWSASDTRAYRLADNRLAELAQWDEESLSIELSAIIELDDTPIELLGWETAEIDVLLAQGAGASPAANDPADDIPEPPDEPVSQPGDLWQLSQRRSRSLRTSSGLRSSPVRLAICGTRNGGSPRISPERVSGASGLPNVGPPLIE